ncbi:phosphoribosyltransferase-like protein [Petrimonas sulfuriphila]|uniref:phosphoribosyltransferase-like protein n=1 Tax=Petrimonas TaxID=307628 RepID=UPI002B3AEB1F|nr:hypothetical protein [Petrimonas sp.]MEA5070525.1 hypothetical protein [Petrimonas sp.]MEA5081134.1 hypothetical protein [Dysgonamonadaceae bacterium]
MSVNITEDTLPIYDRLLNKVITYYATIWRDRRSNRIYEEWLSNFKDASTEEKEKLHALFLLSKFMYFGNIELRELLKCVFRDLFKYPIVAEIRQNNGNSKDVVLIDKMFKEELSKTRFLGVGNPSESGVHLLYYFRQENNLEKGSFLNTHEIFKNNIIKEKDANGIDTSRVDVNIKNPDIKRYVFIDDFCGSGTQAKEYSKDIVEQIKSINKDVEVNYLMLFGTEDGISSVKNETKFDRIETVFSIDSSFKCFSDASRYFCKSIDEIEKDFCREMCKKYGDELWAGYPLGYKDGQLLLSLFHNTPDNTLPIFWAEGNDWTPIFKRFHKIY